MKGNRVQASVTQVQQWTGPLPAPDSLIRYNDAVPDAAERILAMAEKEMEHRHKKENAIVEQEGVMLKKMWRLSLISTILGFVSVIILSALVGYSLYTGADGIALGGAIGAIAAVAGLFTYSQIIKNRRNGTS